MRHRKGIVEKIRDGMQEAIEHEKGTRQLTVHRVKLVPSAKPMTPQQIVKLRKDTVGVSQAVFANILSASPQTIRAWEQGCNKPRGVALRFMEVIKKNPEIATQMLHPA